MGVVEHLKRDAKLLRSLAANRTDPYQGRELHEIADRLDLIAIGTAFVGGELSAEVICKMAEGMPSNVAAAPHRPLDPEDK